MSEEIGNLVVKVGADITSFKNSLSEASSILAEAFAVKEIINFGVEAGKAGDIQENFNRVLGTEGVRALQGMQTETLGTIDKYDLMSDAIQANIRGIDAQYLPSLARLTQQLKDSGLQGASMSSTIDAISRAAETGLTRGLVPLGVNVGVLKEQLKGATTEGERMTIIMNAVTDASNKLAAPTVDVADQVEQMKVQWHELSIELGNNIAPILSRVIGLIQDGVIGVKTFTLGLKQEIDAIRGNLDFSGVDVVNKQGFNYTEAFLDLQKQRDEVGKILDGQKQITSEVKTQISGENEQGIALQSNLGIQTAITAQMRAQTAFHNSIISSTYLNVDTEAGGQYMGGQARYSGPVTTGDGYGASTFHPVVNVTVSDNLGVRIQNKITT